MKTVRQELGLLADRLVRVPTDSVTRVYFDDAVIALRKGEAEIIRLENELAIETNRCRVLLARTEGTA